MTSSSDLIRLPSDLGQRLDASDSPEFYGCILNRFLNESTDAIMSFFASKRDEIKTIYDAIKENKYPHNKVLMTSVENAQMMFSEYFKGLHEYAENLVELENDKNISKEAIQKMVSDVKYKNNIFIESIINGTRNPEKSVTISEAMVNIENVKLIISSYMEYNEKAKFIFQSLNGKDNDVYIEEISIGLKTYVSSIGEFAYRCLAETVNSYNNIMDSMKQRVPVNGIKEIPKYKIF